MFNSHVPYTKIYFMAIFLCLPLVFRQTEAWANHNSIDPEQMHLYGIWCGFTLFTINEADFGYIITASKMDFAQLLG